jgi:hypothetical protein
LVLFRRFAAEPAMSLDWAGFRDDPPPLERRP